MSKMNSYKVIWLVWTCSITLVLATIYLVMHHCDDRENNEIKYLNKNQINLLISLITQSNDSINEVETRKIIKDYYVDVFSVSDTSYIIKKIETVELKKLQILLPNYPIKTKCFFWLNGPGVLIEIIFWSLFGLISNLLYSVTRAPKFEEKKITEHIGKFFYTPFLAIIIYLSINALMNTGTISFEGINKGIIVLAFILGFYTRRTIVLIGRVKDLIFPAKERDNVNEEVVEEKPDLLFSKLGLEDQKRIINEFIVEKSEEYKNKYPEIQGISARLKNIKNIDQDYYCIHFDIIKKESKIKKQKALPNVIEFVDSLGSTHTIPTDVSGVGENELEFSNNPKFVGENQFPKQLGLSCSREDVESVGTIGLKVFKYGESDPYLLSCFHVLCSPELSNKTLKFQKTSMVGTSVVISPGAKDCEKNLRKPIADIEEGVLSHTLDAAIAKLNVGENLENVFYNYNGRVNGIRRVDSNDVRKRLKVYLFGRTSGSSEGYLIDNYQARVYLNYPSGTLKNGELWNLIVASKISAPGDSGSMVVDANNNLIGMLVGSNKLNSFIIPIGTIFNKFDIDSTKLF